MDRVEIYGALVSSDASTELTVVSSISDVSPLDITANFEQAAKSAGETVSVKAYAPTPQAPAVQGAGPVSHVLSVQTWES